MLLSSLTAAGHYKNDLDNELNSKQYKTSKTKHDLASQSESIVFASSIPPSSSNKLKIIRSDSKYSKRQDDSITFKLTTKIANEYAKPTPSLPLSRSSNSKEITHDESKILTSILPTSSSSHTSSIKMMIATSSALSQSTLFPLFKPTSARKLKTLDPYNVFNDYDDNHIIHSSSSQVYNLEKYRPEVGVRIAIILGSMLVLIILYLLWRNRCRCICRNGIGSSSSDDYDMEFWLKHVDNQKLARKRRFSLSYNAKLPDAVSNPHEATAAWVLQHKKVWTNMKQAPRRANNTNLLFSNTNNETLFSLANSRKSPMFKNYQERGELFTKLLSPFKKNKAESRAKRNEAMFAKQMSRRKSNQFEDLDYKTQLLINYARIDAINNTKFTSKPTISAIMPGIGFNNQNTLSVPGGGGLLSRQSSSNTKKSKQNGSNSSSRLNVNQAGGSEGSKQQTPSDNRSRSSIDEEFYIKMITANRRRRHSWPRCKSDHLHMNNFSRELRMLHYRKQLKQSEARKQAKSIKNKSNAHLSDDPASTQNELKLRSEFNPSTS